MPQSPELVFIGYGADALNFVVETPEPSSPELPGDDTDEEQLNTTPSSVYNANIAHARVFAADFPGSQLLDGSPIVFVAGRTGEFVPVSAHKLTKCQHVRIEITSDVRYGGLLHPGEFDDCLNVLVGKKGAFDSERRKFKQMAQSFTPSEIRDHFRDSRDEGALNAAISAFATSIVVLVLQDRAKALSNQSIPFASAGMLPLLMQDGTKLVPSAG